jgi:RNA polymerase sigma factor (sigma-70 family)
VALQKNYEKYRFTFVTSRKPDTLIIDVNTMNDQETLSTGTIPDSEIIARVLQGEKDLYALLVRRYNQRLYRVGMSMINDDAEVEDVMQVAYIKAYENLAQFEFKAVFSTWLTRILINECLLRIRKRKRSFPVDTTTMNNEMYQQLTTDTQTPFKKVLNSELKNILQEAIQKLPEKYRTVFIMREIENMNVAETQECLDLSEVNVKVRLNRAKALLRNSLSTYYKKEEILHFHLTRCDRIVDNVMKGIEKL